MLPGSHRTRAGRVRRLGGVGTASIIALLIATLSAGCGSGTSPAGTPKSTAQSTARSSVSRRVEAKSAHSHRASSTSSSSSKTAPSGGSSTVHSATPRAPHVGGRLLRRFAGSGNTRLGTVTIDAPALLVWHSRNPAIQIFTARGFMLVDSHTANGTVALSRGRYPAMRVATRAGWTIELRARS